MTTVTVDLGIGAFVEVKSLVQGLSIDPSARLPSTGNSNLYSTGAVDVTKPYKFTGFGAMDVTKPYKFIGFWGHGCHQTL